MKNVSVVLGSIISSFTKHLFRKRGGEAGIQDELLFTEAFTIAKDFIANAALHSCEKLQKFGNTWVPSPPSVRIVAVLVPPETRKEASDIIIDTLGEEDISNVIGGKNWWQQSASESIEAEFVSMKDLEFNEPASEYEEEERKQETDIIHRLRTLISRFIANEYDPPQASEEKGQRIREKDEDEYCDEMDEMPCMLYIHGGAYFFGSINTHRYSIWRFARKIEGRAFTINYRLSPQYPFPCALADALAAYLYLIRPPPGAKHKPVDPKKITVAGDSAGGGLALALLCMIRDAELPAPAGATLVSPWVDLTHSFPSIYENGEMDIVPYGFFFKPSVLWPPPKSTTTTGTFDRNVINWKTYLRAKDIQQNYPEQSISEILKTVEKSTEEEITPVSVLSIRIDDEMVGLELPQIQLYATNEQLTYPFVSPAWQPSLGGLPPLYIMCGDKERLRDEIIHTAHRAAYPTKYPIRQELMDANPIRAAKAKEHGPTKVHLQVYDEAPHDLTLLSMTRPAKYCYRAIGSFVKFVTADPDNVLPTSIYTPAKHPSIRRKHSVRMLMNHSVERTHREDFFASRKPREIGQINRIEETIYSSHFPFNRPEYQDNMIRERVSIKGVIRPLEPESSISALRIPAKNLALLKDPPLTYFLEKTLEWQIKFSHQYTNVAKLRQQQLQKSQDEEKSVTTELIKKLKEEGKKPLKALAGDGSDTPNITDSPASALVSFSSSVLEGEHPPLSSIACRRDTREGRLLARSLRTRYASHHMGLYLWTNVQDLGSKVKENETLEK